jgi:guanine deaminase
MRLIGGKALMDRNAPPELCETLEDGLADTEALIAAYSGRGRLDYAVSPRFAFACSDPHLAMAGDILARHPSVRMHTHLSENHGEIAAVAAAFPGCRDYLDVYAKFGLLTDRSVFAHGVHLDDDAFGRIGAAGAAIAFCPTSNLFLGSGLFPLQRALGHGVKLGLGTDVGGGTSFSLFRTMDEAYKVGQLGGASLDPFRAFHMATLGGAEALGWTTHRRFRPARKPTSWCWTWPPRPCSPAA